MKREKMRQLLAILLAGTMVAGLAACSSDKGDVNTQAADTQAVSQETKDTPLVIANDAMNEKFSPFFVSSVPDQNIVDLTQLVLITNDRAGQYIYDGMGGVYGGV